MSEVLKILDAIKELREEIKTLSESKSTTIANKSEELKDLFGALAKAQAEMRFAEYNNNNPYYKSKYADLSEFIRVSRPALTKHGLSVIQQIIPNEDGQNILHTILAHSSGQWIESRMRIIPPKSDIQTLGSYITYLRRYSYASLVGIVASDDDDDGEIATHSYRQAEAEGTKLNTKYDPREESYETITKEQLEELQYELGQYPELVEDMLLKYKIQNISDLPKSKFIPIIERVREIKILRNETKKRK